MKFENVDEMVREAESTFRKGLGSLSEWSDQARELLESKPGIVMAAAGISGFVAGALLRHGMAMRRSIKTGRRDTTGILQELVDQDLPVDPLLLLAGGILAGVIAGPLLIDKALNRLSSIDRKDSRDEVLNFESARSDSANAMDEKPFEKF